MEEREGGNEKKTMEKGLGREGEGGGGEGCMERERVSEGEGVREKERK